MNPVKAMADRLYLLAILFLVARMKSTKNVLGISYRTQEVYLFF